MIDDPVPIRAASIEPYRLALVRPWITAAGERRVREGWLLHIEDADGHHAVGECAPLPEAGTESADAAARGLEDWTRRLPGLSLADFWTGVDADPPSPAVRCALEAAALGLAASRRGLPMARLLNSRAAGTVAVNAAIGIADPGLAERAAAAAERGFRVLKVKLGVEEPGRELDALRAAARGLPGHVRFRLDANGAWDAAEARRVLEALADLPVESLEEPLAGAEPADLRALAATASFPLALDESLPRFLAAGLCADLPVQRMVLKPMVLGGARPCLRLAGMARRQVVVTTALEAAPGRWLAAHLAAALDSGLAHGLDTGSWLAEDLATGPEIEDGACRVVP